MIDREITQKHIEELRRPGGGGSIVEKGTVETYINGKIVRLDLQTSLRPVSMDASTFYYNEDLPAAYLYGYGFVLFSEFWKNGSPLQFGSIQIFDRANRNNTNIYGGFVCPCKALINKTSVKYKDPDLDRSFWRTDTITGLSHEIPEITGAGGYTSRSLYFQNYFFAPSVDFSFEKLNPGMYYTDLAEALDKTETTEINALIFGLALKRSGVVGYYVIGNSDPYHFDNLFNSQALRILDKMAVV